MLTVSPSRPPHRYGGHPHHAHHRRSPSSQSTRRARSQAACPVSPIFETAALLPVVRSCSPLDPSEEEEEDAAAASSAPPFELKETSEESSDSLDDDDDGGEDDDSSSSLSSSGSTPPVKPVESSACTASRRVTPSSLPGLSPAAVCCRPMRPSLRQFKVSAHYYSPLKLSSRPPLSSSPAPAAAAVSPPLPACPSPSPSSSSGVALRLHRRKQQHERAIVDELRPDDAQKQTAEVAQTASSLSPLVSSAVADVPRAFRLDVVHSPSCDALSPLPPLSSVSRYALLVAILRRSDGRDKLVKTAYYGSNELRWLMQSIVSKVRGNRQLAALLSRASSSSALLRSLAAMAVLWCTRLDSRLASFADAMGSARQLLRLGRWVYDLQSLQEAWQEWKQTRDEQQRSPAASSATLALLELINAFLSLIIDVFDDVEWLSEQRILPASVSAAAGSASALLWLLTLSIDIPLTLSALWQTRAEGKATQTAEWRTKLLLLLRYAGDAVYAASLCRAVTGCNVSDGWGQTGGLISALVSLYKLSRSESLHRSVH